MKAALRERVIEAMRRHFGSDGRRIDHTLKVLGYAEAMLAVEPGSRDVVTAAAVLHDIGIPAAERKYGSAAAPYQEAEAPPIAREILRRLDVADEAIEHICLIIGNHHSGRNIDTPEFRIVWDADWLVNGADQLPELPAERRARRIDELFRTAEGKRLATELFLKGSDS